MSPACHLPGRSQVTSCALTKPAPSLQLMRPKVEAISQFLKPHQNRVSITWNVDLPEILGELPIFPAKTISIFGGHVPQRSHRNPLHPRPQASSAISCSALVVTSSESGDGTKTCAFASASSSNPVFFNMFFHYLNTYTHTQTDGWMDGWMGGWVDGWIDR